MEVCLRPLILWSFHKKQSSGKMKKNSRAFHFVISMKIVCKNFMKSKVADKLPCH